MFKNTHLDKVSFLNSIVLSLMSHALRKKKNPKINTKLLKVKEQCFNNIVEKLIWIFNAF